MRAHRLLCLVLVSGLWLGAVLLALRVHTDTGSTAFFPDADAESRSMAGALDLVPASRLLFVSFSTERENGATALAEAADALVRRLPAHQRGQSRRNCPRMSSLGAALRVRHVNLA